MINIWSRFVFIHLYNLSHLLFLLTIAAFGADLGEIT